ncbi:uncharacterized protein E0L32_004340 [Thyridium curvatum]|uniref:Uncharacterized protein n=1 Tax=Thyridium curvatum TaxID=1093900 RepID=A0A507B083_9PEZI|nr:uncharacterized protein E0L32_004340 [Thyridium curvatum]TPX15642.1 hypothetical protein E0L32_004340 [Thyridium curvatum]
MGNLSYDPECPSGDRMPSLANYHFTENANVFSIPGTLHDNRTAGPMSICCAPSTVQAIDGCYLWCHVPARHLEKGVENTSSSMIRCLHENDLSEEIKGFQLYSSSASHPVQHCRPSATHLGFLLLLISYVTNSFVGMGVL